eukprot:NODE_1260_length_1017_cov_229.791322_g877_i0.p1 GENE.NODE_1260_length_1017_cov_229.791322_g877_i0~~NODE_1260_length_1017_cov_229.791322_g877_i0.p1  ORF type:complete len:124 (-),score=15.73 NODE_1260_length_1017_cov_229.791322_g877_i0:645-992(-)
MGVPVCDKVVEPQIGREGRQVRVHGVVFLVAMATSLRTSAGTWPVPLWPADGAALATSKSSPRHPLGAAQIGPQQSEVHPLAPMPLQDKDVSWTVGFICSLRVPPRINHSFTPFQ